VEVRHPIDKQAVKKSLKSQREGPFKGELAAEPTMSLRPRQLPAKTGREVILYNVGNKQFGRLALANSSISACSLL
jgi:hypothetical protein